MSREQSRPWLGRDWTQMNDESKLKALMAGNRSMSFDSLSAALALANRMAGDTVTIEAILRGELVARFASSDEKRRDGVNAFLFETAPVKIARRKIVPTQRRAE